MVENVEVQKPTPEQEAAHAARGALFKRQADKVSQLTYSGDLVKFSWARENPYKLRAAGRVMVDYSSFREMNSDQPRQEYGQAIKTFRAEQLKYCQPRVYGFSFASKQWGELKVETLAEIAFDSDRFRRVVMPDATKRGLQLLIRNQRGVNTDLIQSKGSGLIFLMHGPPGVGKTLTAEAAAESMHKPLYMVNIGELGSQPHELEHRLKAILEICQAWDAVLLLDEADIFMEQRSEHDLQRNAMVGIFIRLLEYQQGILFLTTNRVKGLDQAFASRISVQYYFCDLDRDCRAQIWTQIFAGDASLDYQHLSTFHLNGREIKSISKLALAKAKGMALQINSELLIKEINNYISEKNLISN